MDEMAKHKNRHDLMENEEIFLDDPEEELAELAELERKTQ